MTSSSQSFFSREKSFRSRRLQRGLLLFLFLVLPLSALAQDQTQNADPRFPKGSDKIAKKEAEETIKKLESVLANDSGGLMAKIRSEIIEKYQPSALNDKGEFDKHPWLGTLGGRNPVDSELDWLGDSMQAILGFNPLPGSSDSSGSLKIQRFMKCFQPKLIRPYCEYCQPPILRPDFQFNQCPFKLNNGFTFAYWWPETTFEINDFGISALNPVISGQTAREKILIHDLLAEIIDKIWRQPLISPVDLKLRAYSGDPTKTAILEDFPDGLRDKPHLGHTQFEGLLPGNQELQNEAHVYRTRVAKKTSEKRNPKKGKLGFQYFKVKIWFIQVCVPYPFWYNGYIKGNKECFYNTLTKDGPTINAWTEEEEYAPFWRIPELSRFLDDNDDDAKDKLYTSCTPTAIPGIGPAGLVYDTKFALGGACSAYRAAVWPDLPKHKYADLEQALGIKPMKPGKAQEYQERCCYPGGGELFPVVGNIAGHFSPLVAAAYLGRRALYLAAVQKRLIADGGDNRTNKFSDIADKLQRVSPEATDCFRINDVDELDTDLFPKDKPDPGVENQSIRYIYWNMRVACTCQYRGIAPANPFKGIAQTFIPWKQGEGCHPYQYTKESEGNVDQQDERGTDLGPTSFLFAQSAWQLYPFGLIPGTGGGLGGVLGGVGDVLGGVGGVIGGAAGAAGGGLVGIASGAAEAAGGGLVGIASSAAGAAGGGLVGIASSAAGAAGGGLVGIASSAAGAAGGGLVGIASSAAGGVSGAFQNLAQNVVNSANTALSGGFSQILGQLPADLTAVATNAGSQIIGGLAQAVPNVSGIAQVVSGEVAQFGGTVVGAANTALSNLNSVTSGALGQVTQVASNLQGTATGLVNAGQGALQTATGQLTSAVGSGINNTVQQVAQTTGVTQALNGVRTTINNAVTQNMQALTSTVQTAATGLLSRLSRRLTADGIDPKTVSQAINAGDAVFRKGIARTMKKTTSALHRSVDKEFSRLTQQLAPGSKVKRRTGTAQGAVKPFPSETPKDAQQTEEDVSNSTKSPNKKNPPSSNNSETQEEGFSHF